MVPFISVIIPTCFREKFLFECVASIMTQDYRDFEVIIIDQADGSGLEDGLRSRYPGDQRICYIHTERGGAARARNIGLSRARGPVAAFIDDDAVADTGWLRAIGETFSQEPKPALMAGRLLPLWDSGKPEWYPADRQFLLGLYDIGTTRRVMPEGDLPIGANMAGLLDIITAHGGFDEALGWSYFRKRKTVSGEETILGRRIRDTGHVAVYEPQAVVWHHIAAYKLSRSYFVKRHFWEGSADASQMSLLGRLGPSPWPHYRYHIREMCMAMARFILPGYGRAYTHPAPVIRMLALSRIAYSCGVIYEIATDSGNSGQEEPSPPPAGKSGNSGDKPSWLPAGPVKEYSIADFRTGFVASRPDLADVRDYNRQMTDILASLKPVSESVLLDVGASPHGFALERALELGVSEYCGIGLGCPSGILVRSGKSTGVLLKMNAEQLDLPSAAFDLIISLSTFEHFLNPTRVLCEMYRVLKPGGAMLVSLQPVWSSVRGHHLHHIPDVCGLLPPWSHLRWSKDEMREQLRDSWPATASMTLEQVLVWIYDSDEINRLNVDVIREAFLRSPFQIEWITPMRDELTELEAVAAEELSRTLGRSLDDFSVKGLSALFAKSE